MFLKLLLFIFISAWSYAYAAPDGEQLYGKYCSACHGAEGNGGVGVPLSLPSFLSGVTDDYLQKSIRIGRPGRVMPAFPEFSDAQVEAISAFIRQWSDKPAPVYASGSIKGNEKHGKAIYLKRCASCHGEEGAGGKGTGVTFSRKRDYPLIAPALNNPGFLAAASDAMIKHTIVRGRKGTIMSAEFAKSLDDSGVNDVVSFIRSFEKKIKTKVISNTDKSPTIIVDSPYSMKETIENLKQAISDQNFTIIRTDYLEHGLTEEGGENKKQVVVHFCNFEFLYEALAIDPRVGVFLPCRVTVVELKGKVQLMTINPLQLSSIFNNDELDDACDRMTTIYKTILEDATL